jgi:hypothetical protein
VAGIKEHVTAMVNGRFERRREHHFGPLGPRGPGPASSRRLARNCAHRSGVKGGAPVHCARRLRSTRLTPARRSPRQRSASSASCFLPPGARSFRARRFPPGICSCGRVGLGKRRLGEASRSGGGEVAGRSRLTLGAIDRSSTRPQAPGAPESATDFSSTPGGAHWAYEAPRRGRGTPPGFRHSNSREPPRSTDDSVALGRRGPTGSARRSRRAGESPAGSAGDRRPGGQPGAGARCTGSLTRAPN